MFTSSPLTNAYICTNRPIIYDKWTAVPEFCELLQTVDTNPEITTAAIGKAEDEGTKMEECTNEKYGDDEPTDDMSNETDLVDSVNDDESFEGLPVDD